MGKYKTIHYLTDGGDCMPTDQSSVVIRAQYRHKPRSTSVLLALFLGGQYYHKHIWY